MACIHRRLLHYVCRPKNNNERGLDRVCAEAFFFIFTHFGTLISVPHSDMSITTAIAITWILLYMRLDVDAVMHLVALLRDAQIEFIIASTKGRPFSLSFSFTFRTIRPELHLTSSIQHKAHSPLHYFEPSSLDVYISMYSPVTRRRECAFSLQQMYK